MARETRRLDKVVGGTTGMAIISEGIAYVCEEVGVDKFRLMQQPGFLVNSEQRMFELVKEDYFYGKEEKRNKKIQLVYSVNCISGNDCQYVSSDENWRK